MFWKYSGVGLFVFIHIPIFLSTMYCAFSFSCPGIGFIRITGTFEVIHSVIVKPPGFVITKEVIGSNSGICVVKSINFVLEVWLVFVIIFWNSLYSFWFFPYIMMIWYDSLVACNKEVNMFWTFVDDDKPKLPPPKNIIFFLFFRIFKELYIDSLS